MVLPCFITNIILVKNKTNNQLSKNIIHIYSIYLTQLYF